MLNTVQVFDKRIKLDFARDYGVIVGASSIIVKNFTASTFSNSSVEVQCNPPNRGSILNRIIYVKPKCKITIVGDAGAGHTVLFTGANGATGKNVIVTGDGLRAFPLANATNTINLSLSDGNFSTNVNKYASALFPRFHTSVFGQEFSNMSGTPQFPDMGQTYYDTLLTNRDPFVEYVNSLCVTRGAYDYNVLVNTQTRAEIEFEFIEPLMLSPLLFGDQSVKHGISGIDTMSLSLQFGNLARMWCRAVDVNSDTITGHQNNNFVITGDILGCSVRCMFLSPPANYIPPPIINLNYYKLNTYNTNLGVVGAGVQDQVTSNSIQLESIPNKIYIYIRESDSVLQSAQGPYVSDTFANISALDVTWSGKGGLMSSMTQNDIYNMSVDNGYMCSYPEWQLYIGSVVCILPGVNLELNQNQAPGSMGSFDFDVKVTYKNISSVARNLQLYIVTVNEGYVSIGDGSVKTYVGILNDQSVMSAKPSNLTFTDAKHVFGSGIFGDIWDFAKKAVGTVRDVVSNPFVKSMANQYLPKKYSAIVNKASDLSKQAQKHGMGRGLIGGGDISKEELRDYVLKNM